MTDLDELARNSLSAAYREEISSLFRALVSNLVRGDPDAVTNFARGMKLAQEAFEKATWAIDHK